MEAETAQSILYVIATIALVAWLAGLRFLLVSFRPARPATDLLDGSTDAGGQPGSESPRREGLIAGHAEVEGRPAELSARAAAVLARESQGMLEQLKILQRTEDRVTFEGAGPTMGRSLPVHIRLGQLRFTPLDSQHTAIDYAIAVSGGRWLVRLGAAFQVLGLIALVFGFLLIRIYVVPNPQPGVRAQAIQMFQVIHFLWPPFLFGGLYRMGRRAVQTRFDALAHNLPYYQAEPSSVK